MDLVPKPDQVVAATGNVVHLLTHGGLADLRPMPRSLVDAGAAHAVHHYDTAPIVTPQGDPVLLVSPLAAPPSCYDLRRGCSLVEHLVADGRPTYLVEYGDVSFSDSGLGLGRWVLDVVPDAVRVVSRHAGGRPVHLVGWGLGGIFAALVTADGPDLPIASLTLLGSPFDVTGVPMVAPVRPLLTAADIPEPVRNAHRVLRAISPRVVRWAVGLATSPDVVSRPVAVAAHLDDRDWLAQVEAVDRFRSTTSAYPGRSFGQLYHRFAAGNALATGTVDVGTHPVSLAAVTAPTLVVAGASDGIAPVASVRAGIPLLTGAREARFEIVPGGHLGLLTGRAARTTTWPTLDSWFREWDDGTPPPASDEPIGTSRRRQHRSSASRALAQRSQ
jgi:poly[(R)-3-hydroxyalkanoate] polymerase subunit PhaC